MAVSARHEAVSPTRRWSGSGSLRAELFVVLWMLARAVCGCTQIVVFYLHPESSGSLCVTRIGAKRASRAANKASNGKAQQDAEAALAAPLEAFRDFFLDDRPFIGGDMPSIADVRWAVTLEFLRPIDYDFPGWAEEYLARVEEALGEAYSEPAADVRGYIESVKSPTT